VTATSPLRGPKNIEGGGFAAAAFRTRRACYGAAPPASRVLRIALRATALRAALDPGDHCGPWEQEERAGPGLPPCCARRANPPVAGHKSPSRTPEKQLNWRSIVTRNGKITNLGRCQGSSEADPSRIK
jgi:hypothetical protein